MLRAHDYWSALLEGTDQTPHLLSRLYIQANSWLVKNYRLCLTDKGHAERKLSLHATRTLFYELVFMLSQLTSNHDVIDLGLLTLRVYFTISDSQSHEKVLFDRH